MASGSRIRAGGAYVELMVRDNALTRGLRQAQARLRAFSASTARIGAAAAAAGAAIIAPLTAAANKFASFGDTLDKVALRTGVSVEALSELGFAAEQSGADLGTIEKGVRRMQAVLFDAALGSKLASESLKEIGYTAKDLEGLSPEDQFTKMADGLASIEDESRRAAVAQKLFGRAGTSIAGMAPDIAKLREEARGLGLTMSTLDAKSAAAYTDAMNRMRRVMDTVIYRIGGALAPVLTQVNDAFAKAGVGIAEFIDRNREIVVWVAKVGVVLSAAGAALLGVAGLAATLGFAFGGIASVMSFVGGAVGVFAAALAAIATPAGIMVGA